MRRHVEVVMTGKLMPGTSVSFVVPKYDFPEGSNIFLSFNYAWELDRGERVRDEARHHVYFISGYLPAWPEARP